LLRSENIDLQKTVEMCRAAETTKAQLRDMTSQPDTVNAVNKSHNKSQHSYTQKYKPKHDKTVKTSASAVVVNDCSFCGKTREKNKLKCPAYGKKCSKCKQMNHFAVKCRAPKVQAVAPDASSGLAVFMVSDYHHDDQLVTFKLESGNYLRFQLDTGAQCNVVPVHLYKLATLDKKLSKFTKNTSHIVSYGGTRIPVIGCVRLLVSRKDTECYLDCKLINAPTMRPILGRKACVGLQLI